MFTKKYYVKSLYKEIAPQYGLTYDQETKIINILRKDIDWDNLRKETGIMRKTVHDVIHSIVDEDKIPYIMNLYHDMKGKYQVMSDNETLKKEEENAKQKIQETKWELIRPEQYRNMVDKIAYESTLI